MSSRDVRRSQDAILKFLVYIRSELMSKLDDLKADVADYHAKVVAKVEELKAAVEALKGQPAGVSDADLQGVIDQVDAFKAELSPPAVEAPAPAPAEPTA